jgi:excisionase family DNA binding protein
MTLIQILESRQEALTAQEVGELLGVSDKHIYEMIANGTLPAFHVGRSIRLDPQDVADWLRRKRSCVFEKPGQKPVGKPRPMTRKAPQRADRAAYGILRRTVNRLEAAAAIENLPPAPASEKSPL